MFMFAPESEAAQENVLPKDIIFVVDRSGSMSVEKIEQARNALHFILNQLNPDDRFSIIGFDDYLAVLSETLQQVDRQSLADARNFVDGLYADGSTNLEAALQTGLAILDRSESRASAYKMVIFLTDGLPTAGITDTGLINAFHLYGVHMVVNLQLRLLKIQGPDKHIYALFPFKPSALA